MSEAIVTVEQTEDEQLAAMLAAEARSEENSAVTTENTIPPDSPEPTQPDRNAPVALAKDGNVKFVAPADKFDKTKADSVRAKIVKAIVEGAQAQDFSAEYAGQQFWELQCYIQPRTPIVPSTGLPSYSAETWHKNASDVANDVAMEVALETDTIRIDDWVRAYLAKKNVAESGVNGVPIGIEDASLISFFEWRQIIRGGIRSPRFIVLDRAACTYEVQPDWIGFCQTVIADRKAAGRAGVSSKQFAERLDAHVKGMAALKTTLTPAQIEAERVKAERQAINAKRAATSKALDDTLTVALADKVHDAESLMKAVNRAAEAAKIVLPKQVGYDPSRLTPELAAQFVQGIMARPDRDGAKVALQALGKAVKAAWTAIKDSEALAAKDATETIANAEAA